MLSQTTLPERAKGTPYAGPDHGAQFSAFSSPELLLYDYNALWSRLYTRDKYVLPYLEGFSLLQKTGDDLVQYLTIDNCEFKDRPINYLWGEFFNLVRKVKQVFDDYNKYLTWFSKQKIYCHWLWNKSVWASLLNLDNAYHGKTKCSLSG